MFRECEFLSLKTVLGSVGQFEICGLRLSHNLGSSTPRSDIVISSALRHAVFCVPPVPRRARNLS